MKKTYENGYLPKIAYHTASNNIEKAQYFKDKQIEKYGPITTEQWMFVIDEVVKIKDTWAIEEREMNSHLGYI
jgi:hypothetical protein